MVTMGPRRVRLGLFGLLVQHLHHVQAVVHGKNVV